MAAKSSDWRPGPTVCRCCFAEGCYKDISTEYFWMGKREVYAEMLLETFDVSILYAQTGGPNSNSRLICEPCISRLRDACDFKRQVVECERVFHQQLAPATQPALDVIEEEPLGSTVKLEQVKVEAKLSDDEDFDDRTGFPDDDDDDLDDEPLTKLATKVPKKESVDLMDLLDNAKPEKRKSTTKIKASPSKKTKKKETAKASTSKAVAKPAEKKNKDAAAVDPARKNALVILTHSTAYPFQPSRTSFRCCFCPNETPPFHDPTLFRQHMDSIHADVDKGTCLKHPNDSMRRVDITNLHCKKKDCIDSFLSLDDLARHLNDVHGHNIDLKEGLGLVPLRLEKDKFSCVICSRSYTTLHQLSRHSGTHFFRNICYICGANFETLKGLTRHVTFTHSSHKYLCPTCVMPFPDIKAKKEHLRTSKKCRSFKCSVCKERFLHLEAQQEHLVKVHGKTKVTYTCPECGEVFEKRIRRYLHFKKFHTDDFKCSHCDMKFSTGRCLRDHIATVHSFERPYKCTVCEKTFTVARTLRTHTLIHDESKQYRCPACNRRFIMKVRLKNHIQKHHPAMFSVSDVSPVVSQ